MTNELGIPIDFVHDVPAILDNFADIIDTMPADREQIQGAMWNTMRWLPGCGLCAAGWVYEVLFDHAIPERPLHELQADARCQYENRYNAIVDGMDWADALSKTINANDGRDEPSFEGVTIELRQIVKEARHANS